MKKYFYLATFLLVSFVGMSQAKKPRLMIFPDDTWMNENGYLEERTMNGTTYYVPDYVRAFVESSELKVAIARVQQIFKDREFDVISVADEIKKMQNESANEMTLMSKSGSEQQESVRDAFLKKVAPDIYLELYWEEISTGFARQLNFTLTAKDSYTAKPVSTITNVGPESSSALVILIDEAVTANLNQFIAQMNDHFNTMFTIGREIILKVGIWDSFEYDLEEEFDHEGLGMEDELGYLIEEWMALNVVEGRFSTSVSTESRIEFDQVRIPIYNDRGRALDASRFGRELAKWLEDEPFGFTCKTVANGLGSVTIMIGEK
tara:strand:+ start:830 stop:1789 length:960 start_codon:yes stop_codon:yes gene_type:complete